MARPRSKPYKAGDKMVVYIPQDIDVDTLGFINAPKYVSPIIMELVKERAKEEAEYKRNKKKSE
jgi:hypothetical protein